MSTEATSTQKITVAIPSYQRPELLRALLDALPGRIAEVTDAVIEVLVLDNDPAGSARVVANDSALNLRYVLEEKPGIAAVRNRALDECSSSDALAFIDDDEIPRPGWLPSLLKVWREHRCTAVAGRVISVFDDDVDPWILASGTFRRLPRPTGTPLKVAAAGNLLLDMKQVQDLTVRFDETLGLGGGEDNLFTQQIVHRGGTIIWCNESETEDYVVTARLNRTWAKQRAFSSANASVHVSLRLTPQVTKRVALRVKFFTLGMIRILVGALRSLFGRLTQNLRHDARGTRLYYRGRGLVAASLGHHFHEYARGAE